MRHHTHVAPNLPLHKGKLEANHVAPRLRNPGPELSFGYTMWHFTRGVHHTYSTCHRTTQILSKCHVPPKQTHPCASTCTPARVLIMNYVVQHQFVTVLSNVTVIVLRYAKGWHGRHNGDTVTIQW
jgi:hypothetical protein